MPPQTAAPTDPQASADHALRADARRNRAAVLRAAEEVFGAEGPDAPIDEVARRAGVGVGTLYRHFPTKEALLTALVTAHAEPLIEAARQALQADDPGTAFFALVRHLGGAFLGFRALAEAIAAAGIDLHAIKGTTFEELHNTIGRLLVRAQEAGAVRRDVTVTEVVTMMGALCQSDAVARDPSSFSRCVDLVCDGLRWNLPTG
jgi:AcrR family transcriptional regulator